MADKISKLQRWLDLVAYLAGRRFPAALEDVWAAVPAYAEGLEGGGRERETVRRMFERDKDELRRMGIPIETVSISINQGAEESHAYRLATRDFHLPYLRLVRAAESEERGSGRGRPSPTDFVVREDEAGAALAGLHEVAALPGFPLRREARSAFRKLAFDLDPDLLRPAPVLYADDAEAIAAAETLRLLSDALLARKTVTFRYRSMGRDDEGVRTVRPYGLLFQHGRWYLVAWAEDRGDVRMFRAGRIGEARASAKRPGTPDYQVPGDFDLKDYAGRKAWELGEENGGPVQALVWFRFPRSVWADRNGYGELVREDGDGSQLRGMDVHRQEPFLRWVLSLEGDARVEEPPPLREAFRALAAAVARRHAPAPGGAR